MKNITPLEAIELLTQQDVALVDVRQPAEWQSGYPNLNSLGKDTFLITITNDLDDFQKNLQEKIPDQSNHLLFICHAGMRSEIAAKLAEKAGYKNTYNIIGGFAQWVNSGLTYKKMRQS